MVAILVDQKAFSKLDPLRMNKTKKFYIVQDIWKVMQQLEIQRSQSYIENYLNKQNKLDPESDIHTPDLYAVWNLKSYITHKIAKENPFNSSFFVYTDTGAFREWNHLNWPDTEFITNNLSSYLNNRVLFGQAEHVERFEETGCYIQGTFFAGNQKAVSDFYNNHFAIHDFRIKQGLFIGKDQIMMNLIAFRYYNSSIVVLNVNDIKCPFRFDKWFFISCIFFVV